jgi:hypothetical protein
MMPDGLPAHRHGFRYSDVTIGVASPEPSHIAWLEEFLTPAFGVTEPEGCDRWVVLDTDPTRHAAAVGRGPSPTHASVPCFVLDSRTECHPEWSGSGLDEWVLFDPGCQAFYHVDRRHGHVRILATSQSGPTRLALMRVVRELTMASILRGSGLVLHGAALATRDGGVILAGPKRAGKTTLLMHALQVGGTAFVTNDRVLVWNVDGRVVLRGMPSIVMIRAETLATFPVVAARIRDAGYHHSWTLAESRSTAARTRRPRRDGGASLTPRQFCAVTSVAPLAEVDAWRLVFPRVNSALSGLHIEPLDAEIATLRLREALFAATSPVRMSPVFSRPGTGPGTEDATLDHRAAELATQVRCYDVHLGTRAYQRPESAAEFIQQLEGPGPPAAAPRPSLARPT